MESGVELIKKERERQIAAEGYDESHDDTHMYGELAIMAACYCAPIKIFTVNTQYTDRIEFVDPFPFESHYDKRRGYGERKENPGNMLPEPENYTIEENRDLLIKAGALIAAEIDRLNRIEKMNGAIATDAK